MNDPVCGICQQPIQSTERHVRTTIPDEVVHVACADAEAVAAHTTRWSTAISMLEVVLIVCGALFVTRAFDTMSWVVCGFLVGLYAILHRSTVSAAWFTRRVRATSGARP
jgi:hypothetical protein